MKIEEMNESKYIEPMKNFGAVYFVFLLALSIGPFTSCSNDPIIDEFLIKVDSIKVPTVVSVGTQFKIEFFGTISTDGCSAFSHFTVNQSNSEILIEAWKEVEIDAVICPTVMVYLDGEMLDYYLEIPGTYLIKIKQPDNTFLEEYITVN